MKSARLRQFIAFLALNLLCFQQVVQAATINLATQPLANTTPSVVFPNIMFMLDNSGSMAWNYLPDYVSAGSGGTGSSICWNGTNDTGSRAQCPSNDPINSSSTSTVTLPLATSDINYIYYNPNIRYRPPVKADGTSYPASNPSAALMNGFDTGSATTNLATSVTKNATASANSTQVTLSDTASLSVGMMVSGPGVAPGTFLATTTNPVTLSRPVAAALSNTPLTFTSGAYNHQIFCSTTSPTTVQRYSAAGVTSATPLTKTGTTTSGSATVTSIATSGLYVGMAVSGTGIASGTTIAAIPSATSVTLSASATASVTSNSLTFTPVCVENGDTTGNQLFPWGSYTNPNTYAGAPFHYVMSPLQYCTDSYFTDCVYGGATATHTVPANYRWCNAYSNSGGTNPTFTDCQDLRDETHTIPNYLGGIKSATTAVAATATLTVTNYVPGLSITNITIGGQPVVAPGTNIVAGSGVNTSTTAIAQSICAAIRAYYVSQGSPASPGYYDCPTTPTSNTLTIVAAATGAWPNGQLIVVSGPTSNPGSAASGTITITNSGATRVDDLKVGTTSLISSISPSTPYYFGAGETSATICSKLASMVNAPGFSASCSSDVMTITAPVGTAYNGNSISLTGSAVSARATITANAAVNTPARGAIGAISVGSTTIQNAQTFNPGATQSNVATQINGGSGAAFQNGFSGGGTSSGTVTIVAPAGNAYNGQSITIAAGATSNASGTISASGTSSKSLTKLVCGSTTVINNTVTYSSTLSTFCGNLNAASTKAAGWTFSYSGSTCNVTAPNTQAACTFTPTWSSGSGSTPTMSGGITTVGTYNYAGSLSGGTFPAADNPAGGSTSPTTNAGYAAASASGSMSSAGTNPTGTIATNATAPSTRVMGSAGGGVNGVDGSGNTRDKVGIFKRVDITPSINSYPATGTKAVERSDCAGTTCTYAEELQNFANWFSYYRTRILMMKSAATLAFSGLDNKYRVGFELLNSYSKPDVELQVARFDDSSEKIGHRTNWWNRLTSTTVSGSTPLRSSLNKLGRYYAGKLTSGTGTPAVAEVKAKGTITISAAKNGDTISSIKVEGVEILGSVHTVSECTGTSNCTNAQRSTLAANLASKINAFVAGGTYNTVNACKGNDGTTPVTCPAYVASASGNTITITAPAVTTATDPSLPTVNGQGSYFNSNPITVAKSGTFTFSKTDLAGGVDAAPAIPPLVSEPIQYSCQQNYAFLVTDGYWNSDSHSSLKQLDGSTPIGNQDNNLAVFPRPYYDGNEPSTTCTDSDFSSCGTLADIAMYYYNTDLRDAAHGNEISSVTGLNVAENNVFTTDDDKNNKQHMSLFAMSLGQPGTLRYRSDYLTATSGDYAAIKNGTKNWPAPKANSPRTIDDLWHATVNGRGKFFSARDPNMVSKGLIEALNSIQKRVGSAAAAATSTSEPTQTDRGAFVTSYVTKEWSGDLQARNIDVVTGQVSEPQNPEPNACVDDPGCPWSARKKLDAMTAGIGWSSARRVYIAPTSGSSGAALRDFTYTNLTATEKSWFDPTTGLTQYPDIHAAYPSLSTVFLAESLVNFIRGDISNEKERGSGYPLWRKRAHVLGDLVNTKPMYVRGALATYDEASNPGYRQFILDRATRQPVVYVSGNDGMLHAFAAEDSAPSAPVSVSGGTELWAFIPTETLKVVKELADTAYAHQYFVDGPIAVGDVYFDGSWHTILVGALGAGGKAYYALDITDPFNPRYLWEISSTTPGFEHLGYTSGGASINKLPSGAWAVLFSSGYNNGDGNPGNTVQNGGGYLYAVNPQTGALLSGFPLATGSGTDSNPSNLGKIGAWVDNPRLDNVATYVYAGDTNGDLWRFDLSSRTVSRLAHLEGLTRPTDGSTPAPAAQPITTKPEMTLIGGKRVIYVGTGQYLAEEDRANTNVQSFYAIKDDAVPSGGWHPRTDTGTVDGVPGTRLFQVRKLIGSMSDGGSPPTVTGITDNGKPARVVCAGESSYVLSKIEDGQPKVDKCMGGPTDASGRPIEMDWDKYAGWYVDLPESGERIDKDIDLKARKLVFASNVPSSSPCTTGGNSWYNQLDYKTGLSVPGSGLIASRKISNALIVGFNIVRLPDGSLVVIAVLSSGNVEVVAVIPPADTVEGKRSLWREFEPY
ncbi:MAG: PilC/PilY family type IV pilus protein [Methylophilaceae bacterium]|nr:PilC/PilY family type IV pilus protein [Methylophilaceae bacterium]